MTHHVFLTGAKQVGKSTLLKKTLRSFDGQIGGFFTLRTCEYLKTGFSVHLLPPLSLQIRMKPTFSLSVARLRRFHQMKRPDSLTAWAVTRCLIFFKGSDPHG